MAASEDTTQAPQLAPVVDLKGRPIERPDKVRRRRMPEYVGKMHRGAADEIIEDCIYHLVLLECYGYLDEEHRFIDAKAVSALACTLVAKLRKAQKHIGEAP